MYNSWAIKTLLQKRRNIAQRGLAGASDVSQQTRKCVISREIINLKDFPKKKLFKLITLRVGRLKKKIEFMFRNDVNWITSII
jgi:hypothetical protein